MNIVFVLFFIIIGLETYVLAKVLLACFALLVYRFNSTEFDIALKERRPENSLGGLSCSGLHVGGATGGVGKLEDVAILVDGLAIVTSLGEGGLLAKLLVLGVVDGTEESGAAVLGTGDKVDGHDGLDPFAAGELEHIIATGVAARSGLDILLGRHGLQVGSGVGGGDDEELIDKGLDVLHTSLEVVDGVLVLELEVGLIVVDTGNDEVPKLAKAH